MLVILRKLGDSHIGQNSNSCPNRVNSDSLVLLRLVGDFTARYIENPPVPKTNEAFGRKREISGLELPNIYSQTMIQFKSRNNPVLTEHFLRLRIWVRASSTSSSNRLCANALALSTNNFFSIIL